MAEHLEAVTNGEIRHLLMNVPPGSMKSMLTDVFWPLWEWGPQNMPATRYLCASYSQGLTVRDNRRFTHAVRSDVYQELWGDRFHMTHLGEDKPMNDHMGWKLATSVGGIGTGERADRIIIDDPHSVQNVLSDAERTTAIDWFQDTITTRVNDPDKSAFVIIMQRVHEEDISGKILADRLGYVHLMIPMEYDSARHCTTVLGFSDPRTQEGELYWPERFSRNHVERELKAKLTKFAVAAQLQQSPMPKGGNIFREDDWQLWPKRGTLEEMQNKLPLMDFVTVSVDTAMTEKEINDPSALTVWGVFRERSTGAKLPPPQFRDDFGIEMVNYDDIPESVVPRIILMYAWTGYLEFNALVEKIRKVCQDYRCDTLLVEAKNNGFSVAQEIVRLNSDYAWSTLLMPTGKSDKVARAYSVQHFFEQKMIYSPNRTWADRVIEQCAVFPKGKHDDLVDTVTQALRYLRDTGMLALDRENAVERAREVLFRGNDRGSIPPSYDV